jgi:Regulator of ribonuclease activity B/Family of unknown function (DUF695)
MGWFSSKKKRAVADGPWDFYSYSYGDGLRASVTFNVEADAEPEHTGHPHCRRVVIHFPHDRVHASGLPVAAEYDRSTDDERALVSELERAGVDCLKVGHMLYGAMRDIVFQVTDVAGFAAAFARWRATRGDREVQLVEKAGWTFFDEKIRPRPVHRMWIQNNHVIIQLLKAGTNRARAHAIDHTFLGAPDAIARVAAEIDAAGLAATRAEPGRLTVVQELALDADDLTTWTLRFEALADEAGASYDGWGAAVVR